VRWLNPLFALAMPDRDAELKAGFKVDLD